MTKYIVAVLVFIATLAGVLLYVGDDAMLQLASSEAKGIFNFGEVKVKWQFAIVMLTLGTIGLLVLWSFLGWLFRLPGRLKSGVGLRRRNQALEAMEEALLAGAEGDSSKARKRAERARGLIASKALGQMISAQAAEASGDSAEAITQYTALLDEKRTEAAGRRGLAQQYLATGNLSGAIEHAGQAYQDNKNARWAFDILLQAQLSDYRWKEAVETIELGVSRKHINKDVAKRRTAVLDTAIATSLEDDGNMEGAIDMAQRAIAAAPDFAPAAALTARLLGKDGARKKALSVLEKAWGRSPHPALSAALLDLLGEESPSSRDKKITHFIRQNPEHRESVLLQIEENLRTGDAVSAWSMLSPMVKDAPSARLCRLAAEAETMLSNEADAKVWALRAAAAPVEPDWSDLDPEGDAFDYAAQDWRRLVFSFGEKGELIHPRFEQGAARKTAMITSTASSTGRSKAAEILETDESLKRQPDDPGIAEDIDTDDLAMRLDSLLEDKAKK